MYVSITGRKGYEQVEIKECVRIPGTNKKKQMTVKRCGSLKALTANDPNYIENLKEELKQGREEKKKDRVINFVTMPKEIGKATDQRPSFHFGHMIIKKLWETMKLDVFFDKHVII